MAVVDGVEDGCVRPELEVLPWNPGRENFLDRVGQSSYKRDLDEYQRFVRQRGMKERETAPVIRKTPVQVIPAANLVYGLVLNELFQNEGRGLPADAFEAQEASIEPRLQEMQYVGIDGAEMRMVREHVSKILSHR